MSGEPMLAKESSPARLIIADDHDLIRSGLRSMLARQPDLEVVGEAANGRKALELCRQLHPDLVLMDIRMPEMDGLTVTDAIKQEFPTTVVLIVTSHESFDYLLEAIKVGAAGYILKEATQHELTTAVRKVLGGESLLDPQLVTQVLKQLGSKAREEEEKFAEPPAKPPEKREEPLLLETFTPREIEVLRLLTRGQPNRQIAQDLLVSVSTVKLLIRSLIKKLGVSDRVQAAVRAVELGLLPPK